MENKNILRLLIILSLFFQILSVEPIETTNYVVKNLKDMKSSLFSSLGDGFYYLGKEIIGKDYTIIAFSDLNGDGFTDIITYKSLSSSEYEFYVHQYNKEQLKFEDQKLLFKINKSGISSIRNLFVGNFYGDKICFLASFNSNEQGKLIHLINCEGSNTFDELDNIHSNILILNRNLKGEMQILFFDDKLKICSIDTTSHKCQGTKNFVDSHNDHQISLTGGMAYVDIDGNCAPDVLLSYDEGGYRHILIFLYDRQNDKYIYNNDIKVGPSDQYGAFTISRIKNEKSQENAPNFDILVPKIKENKIKAFKNQKTIPYKWDKYLCFEDEGLSLENSLIFNETKFEEFELPTNSTKHAELDYSTVTVLRAGDFLSNSAPGILVRQNFEGSSKAISLYSKNEDKYILHFQIVKDDKHMDEPISALFFDINESGSLGLIVKDESGNNHFFFNFRKNTYFVKAKLMNYKDVKFYSDANIGASFRYIVTDQSGARHMDISSQLAQTSDMNIPLPYSLSGINETNNYIENFQILSGNYYTNDDNTFKSKEFRNFMKYTPIIPNTQMKIYKFKNDEDKYEWYADLIVEPTDSLIIIVIILIAVMLVILGVVIYLYVREVKEEKKEESKFKSWFA